MPFEYAYLSALLLLKLLYREARCIGRLWASWGMGHDMNILI